MHCHSEADTQALTPAARGAARYVCDNSGGVDISELVACRYAALLPNPRSVLAVTAHSLVRGANLSVRDLASLRSFGEESKALPELRRAASPK